MTMLSLTFCIHLLLILASVRNTVSNVEGGSAAATTPPPPPGVTVEARKRCSIYLGPCVRRIVGMEGSSKAIMGIIYVGDGKERVGSTLAAAKCTYTLELCSTKKCNNPCFSSTVIMVAAEGGSYETMCKTLKCTDIVGPCSLKRCDNAKCGAVHTGKRK
ncbi:unnamed protein product [Ilex paraguariensis]|uniref:Uncharacterized protein n=1 Tax=Ilex paraguariensis TaxID=185542 RepID=A0ABC8UNE6_9AQUA